MGGRGRRLRSSRGRDNYPDCPAEPLDCPIRTNHTVATTSRTGEPFSARVICIRVCICIFYIQGKWVWVKICSSHWTFRASCSTWGPSTIHGSSVWVFESEYLRLKDQKTHRLKDQKNQRPKDSNHGLWPSQTWPTKHQGHIIQVSPKAGSDTLNGKARQWCNLCPIKRLSYIFTTLMPSKPSWHVLRILLTY